jgi:hypothetical protein
MDATLGKGLKRKTMTLEELIDLEKQATPRSWEAEVACCEDEPVWGWGAVGPRHQCDEDCEDCQNGKDCSEPGEKLEKEAMLDARLLTTLRNLAPEILALWKAVAKMNFNITSPEVYVAFRDINMRLNKL